MLDDEHIDSMIATLEGFPVGEKAAVCFFFHEHVTAILKSPGRAPDGRTPRNSYEFVDSLPQAPSGMGVRIKCQDHAVLKVRSTIYSSIHLCPLHASIHQSISQSINQSSHAPIRTVRGPHSFTLTWHCSFARLFNSQACLSWYCCSKFSERNMGHIDTTPWSDAAAELDPRIFQGHVWHSGGK